MATCTVLEGVAPNHLKWDPKMVLRRVSPELGDAPHPTFVDASRVGEQAQPSADGHVQELHTALARIACITQEASLRQHECDQLRHDLHTAALCHDKAAAAMRAELAQREDRAAAAEAAAQAATARAVQLERDQEGLRCKVRSLLATGAQCQAVGMSVGDVAACFEAIAPLSPQASGAVAAALPKGGISLVKVAAARVEALEAELAGARKKFEEQQELAAALQEASAAKDGEITDMKARMAAMKASTDYQAFKKLTRHAEALAVELKTLQQRTPAADAAAAAAGKELAAAEARAEAAEAAKSRVLREVASLRSELAVLQRDATSVAAMEGKIAKLRVTLDDARAQETAARAAAEVAEGRVAELQDRLDRRAGALIKAQGRCRALEAELRGLKVAKTTAVATGSSGTAAAAAPPASATATPASGADEESIKSMAEHLRGAVQLQEEATLERDEARAEADRLREQLEEAQLELQEAAAAAAVARQRINSAAAASPAAAAEPTHHASSPNLAAACADSGFGLHDVLHHLQTADFERAELEMVAAQHNEVQQALQRRCAELEAQLGSMAHAHAAATSPPTTGTWTASPSSNTGPHFNGAALQAQLGEKIRECEELAAAGLQADAALQTCLYQLRAVTSDLHENRAAAAATLSELHGREAELRSAHSAKEALGAEISALQLQMASARAATEQQAEGMAAAFAAEREAAAADFESLRADLRALSKEYQDVSARAAQAQRERDAAAQQKEHAATEAAYHEQAARAKESELEESAAACRALVDDNRRLQEAVVELQRELASQACNARFGSERAHAALQRRAAAAEGGSALLEARLVDAQAEAGLLRQRLTAEQGRVDELEGLLAEVRVSQFQRESLNAGGEEGEAAACIDAVDEAMQERLAELETGCVRLQQERDALAAQLQAQTAREREGEGQQRCDRVDLLAELAQVSASLQEERQRREAVQEAAQAALEAARPRSGGVIAPNPVRQLQRIADELQGLGCDV